MKRLNILAKTLRKNQTPQEQKLWNILRNRQVLGCKFKRQYPVGNYIVDFACRERKLIIELDGGQHNKTEAIWADKERTIYLQNAGFRVLRFWNDEVDNNIEGVYQKIVEYLSAINS